MEENISLAGEANTLSAGASSAVGEAAGGLTLFNLLMKAPEHLQDMAKSLGDNLDEKTDDMCR